MRPVFIGSILKSALQKEVLNKNTTGQTVTNEIVQCRPKVVFFPAARQEGLPKTFGYVARNSDSYA
jgi:hypothetical protein